MTDRRFDSESGGEFDYSELLDDLRCRETVWLEERRGRLVREQRRLRVEELAVLAVLDERGQVDDSHAAKDGTTTRTARRKRATARKLMRQPNVAKAAAQGRLSDEQLDKVSDLAGDDPEADRLWSEQGPGWSPDDLAAELRRKRKPSVEDAAARREARELRYWWNQDSGMLDGRFSLPDIDGATFASVLDEMIEKMTPVKGQPWDTREHRGADALVDLCRLWRDGGTLDEPTTGAKPHFIVEVPLDGPATVAGVSLPDAMVERLRAQARVEPVITINGEKVLIGKTEPALSEKKKRVVKQRDGHCRYPGCHRRTGLQVHHLWPASWGGGDDLYNLACLCPLHHALMAPQGRVLLLGNPNNPAGLTLLDRDDLPKLAQLAAEQSRADTAA